MPIKIIETDKSSYELKQENSLVPFMCNHGTKTHYIAIKNRNKLQKLVSYLCRKLSIKDPFPSPYQQFKKSFGEIKSRSDN